MQDSMDTFGNAVFEGSISTYIKMGNAQLQCNLFDGMFTMTQIYAEHGNTISVAPVDHSYDPDVANRNDPQVGIKAGAIITRKI